MGLCESNLIKRKREQLFSLYLSQPRSTLYLRGRFILKEKKNRSQVIQDFHKITPSFESKLSQVQHNNSITDFCFDQTGYRGYRDVEEFKNKRLLVRRPHSNTIQVYRLVPFYQETQNPELSQFRLDSSPLLLEAEYVFAKEQYLLLSCSFVESSSKIICFVQEQSSNAISCKLIRLKPSHNQGTRTVIDNFVLKKYIEEVTTGQYLEVNQIATGMNFVTVEDIEYHKKFFRSECFLWGADQVKSRRPHILQDFLAIVDRKTPKDETDPNDVDSAFSYESEAGGVRKTSFYSQSGVTEAEELVAEIRSKKTSSQFLQSSHLLKKSSITSQYIGQLHFESQDLLELSASEDKCRSLQYGLMIQTFKTIDDAASRSVCELYVYFKESRVLTIYSTYGGALYEDNSFLISQKIKSFIVIESKLVLVSYEKLPLIELLNLTGDQPRKEMGVNFLDHPDGRAIGSGITEVDMLVSTGVVQFGTSRKHIHRNKPTSMPIKVAMSGLTRNAKCYLSIFNCSSRQFEYVRIFDRGIITALSFGPFDNGPILTGWRDGSVRYFGTYSLQLLGVYQGEESTGAISHITFDPLSYVYACTDNTVIGFEAMKGVDRYEYLYIDIPRQKPRESRNTTETSYSYLAPRRGTIIIQRDELQKKQRPINHEDDSVLGRREIRSQTV